MFADVAKGLVKTAAEQVKNAADNVRSSDQKKNDSKNQMINGVSKGGGISNEILQKQNALPLVEFDSPKFMQQTTQPALPSVQTASMSHPAEVVDKVESSPSYWDNMTEQAQDDADINESSDASLVPSVDMSGSSMSSANESGYEYAPGEGDINRWGDEYKDDVDDPTYNDMANILWIGDTRNNDRYEDLFATGFNGETQGMSDRDLRTMHSGGWSDKVGLIDPSVVDDGTLDYAHLTSPKILGSQLQRYARNGMAPGMSIDQIEHINPDEVYDKSQLIQEYKFRPYMPDWQTFAYHAAEQPVNMLSSAGSEMSNLRNNIARWTDNSYEIDYRNGDYRLDDIDGGMFDKDSGGYLSNIYHDRQYNPQRFFDDSHDNGGHWSQYATQWETKTPDGEVEYHYGLPTTGYESNLDGTSNIIFDDGSHVTVTDAWLDSLYNEDEDRIDIPYDPYTGDWLIELPDGSVNRFYGDIEGSESNNDGTYSMGFSDGSTAVMSREYLESLQKDEETGNPKLEYNGMVNVSRLGLDLDTAQLNGTEFPDVYVGENGITYDQLDSPNVASYWAPDYVMDDGTVIPYLDARMIAGDSNGLRPNKWMTDPSEQKISYEFGNVGPFTNRPQRFSPSPFSIDDNGRFDQTMTDVGYLGDRMFDWVSGSLPIMIPYTAWPVSVANGLQDLYGLSSGSYDVNTNAYRYGESKRGDDGFLRHDNDTSDAFGIDPRYIRAVSDLGVPLWEELVGPVGMAGSGFGVPNKWFNGPGLRNYLGRLFLGSTAEGWEEVGGRIPDEISQYGLNRSFGNYLDENGDVVYSEDEAALDDQLQPIKQANSPIVDRLYNFGLPVWRDGSIRINPDAIAENANSFTGGFAMSTPMGMLEQGAKNREYLLDNYRLNAMGLDPYNDPEKLRHKMHAPEGYLEQWRDNL